MLELHSFTDGASTQLKERCTTWYREYCFFIFVLHVFSLLKHRRSHSSIHHSIHRTIILYKSAFGAAHPGSGSGSVTVQACGGAVGAPKTWLRLLLSSCSFVPEPEPFLLLQGSTVLHSGYAKEPEPPPSRTKHGLNARAHVNSITVYEQTY
jgi:hypothetical protein